MANCLRIKLLFIVPILVIGFLSFSVAQANTEIDEALQPEFSKTNAAIMVGEKLDIKVVNGGADLVVWSDVSAVKVSRVGVSNLLIVGVKEGKARVTACRQAVYCASINVTVTATKKAAKNTAVTKKITKVALVKSKFRLKTAATPVRLASASVVGQLKSKVLVLSQTKVTVSKLASVDIFVQNSSDVTAVSDSEVVAIAINSNADLNIAKITFTGINPGFANVKICSPDLGCATLQVRVAPNTAGPFSVSEKNVVINSGDTYWLRAVNGINLNVSSNNVWLVSAAVKGDLIFITTASYFNYSGNAILKVCSGQNSSDCALVYVTVLPEDSPAKTYGSFSSVTIEEGQSTTVPFPSDYVLSYNVVGGVGDPAVTPVASIRVNSNNFTIFGKSYGSAVFELCPTTPGNSCGTIGVTVTHRSACGANAGKLALSDEHVTVERWQTADVIASNCVGLAALSSDTDVVRPAVNGNRVTLSPNNVGQVTVDVCDATGACVPLLVDVVTLK